MVETVEEAKNGLQDRRETFGQDDDDEDEYTYEPIEHGIASEGFYVVHSEVDLFFRDANAGARVNFWRDNGDPREGDVATTFEIAATMHKTWRS